MINFLLGFRKKQVCTLPVHRTFKDTMLREWQEPEKKAFLPNSRKRRFPFKEENWDIWEKCPRLDDSYQNFLGKQTCRLMVAL